MIEGVLGGEKLGKKGNFLLEGMKKRLFLLRKKFFLFMILFNNFQKQLF